MMRASVYARKSTEQTGVSDELRSVARQIEHARAYAASKGWTVEATHVYVDDGISGAEFTTRPGLLRLLNALKPRPPFDVLIVSEESRLGRETIETAYVLKQLITAGVRVFSYLEDRERTLNNATEKFMLSLQAMADEMEREKARVRTYDALKGKATAGYVTGGGCFGYRNDRRVDGVHRVIDPNEAEIVRRIFTMAAQGCGLSRIAKSLNDQGVRSPRPQQGRPAGWAPSSVRALLHRDIYRGVLCWNKTKKRDAWGVKHQQARPAKDWIRVEVPDLTIVSDALWTAAQAAMAQQRTRFSQDGNPRHRGRLAGVDGTDARYLLTGLLTCARCRAGIEIRTRSHGGQRVAFIGCSAFHRRGQAVCPNNLTVPEAHANAAVLSELKTSLLNPTVLEAAVACAVAMLCQPDDDGRALRQELVRVKREIQRYTEAIGAGGDVPALVQALRAADDRQRHLNARLRALDDAVADLSPAAVCADLRARLTDWRALLHDEPTKARGVLRQLIVGRLDLVADTDRQGYTFTGTGTLIPILQGVIPALGESLSRIDTSPTGFEPVFWP
jgi:site-specific DNA recombinase